MSFAKQRPAEYRKPTIRILADGRRRLTRYRAVTLASHVTDGLVQPWGAEDAAIASGPTAGFAGLRLVDQYLDSDLQPQPRQGTWIEVYEQISASAETRVGRATQIVLEDGRDAWEYNYLQFRTGPYTAGEVGADTAPDDGSLYLQRVEATDDGCLRRIRRLYVAAGILSQDDQALNNGKLLRRTIVSAKTVPSTPSGYTLVGTPVQAPNGLPIYTYTFYKGDGEISRRTSYSESDDEGTTGVTVVSVTHLTSPAILENPVSSPGAGYTLISRVPQDATGHRVWDVVYAKGTGLVSQSIGRGPAPGLRRVTNVSLGGKVSPDGVIELDTYRLADGYKVFTVTSVQTSDGGSDPTASTWSVERYVPFRYPGRAKAFVETVSGYKLLDVYQDPPVTAKVPATITFSYVTDPTLGTISNLWNPRQWACIRAQWVGLGPEPANLVRALPEYRSVSDTPIVEEASGVAPSDLSVFGNTVYGSEEATVKVSGGPEDPGGNTYTLDAWIEEDPVFWSVGGIPYYRKVVITSTIPTQPALPV